MSNTAANDLAAKLAAKLAAELADRGLIIEGGWYAMQKACLPHDASPIQLSEMRKAYFFGAQHLFASIMSILDPGAEPTERDLHRLDLIDQELRRFVAEQAKDKATRKHETN